MLTDTKYQQLGIDFSKVNHRENNISSQAHYEQNKDRFSRQCKKVYGILLLGIRLTVAEALNKYGIASLPRRCLDLKQLGVDIKTTWIEVQTTDGKTRVKQYHL